MHIRLLAVGDRQPAWVNAAFEDYSARFPRQWQFSLELIATSRRNKGQSSELAKDAEGSKMLTKIRPADYVVALDERGQQLTSKALSVRLEEWQNVGADIVFLIGGPDGLAQKILQRANRQWSLSSLTLPHGLARIVFAEQMYRAWSLLTGHPYHRD